MPLQLQGTDPYDLVQAFIFFQCPRAVDVRSVFIKLVIAS